ncbi:MAG TPA: metallophosphoesterase [Firmicutes bacterium]|nr:metallophosphoesterase [Bacillota bacterium]
MRIGVVSDTHGSLARVVKLIREMGAIDLLLHAGDYYRDAAALAGEFSFPVQAVVGNCDLGVKGPAEESIEVAGWRILLCHGHHYRVKMGFLPLFYRAQEMGADLVVFGHTHRAEKFRKGGIEFLNPGTAGVPDRQGLVTGGIIEIGNRIRTSIIVSRGTGSYE